MKFRRRYALVYWSNLVNVDFRDVANFIEKALGPYSKPWQKPLLVHVDEKKRELIVRVSHLSVPRLKRLSENPVDMNGCKVQLRVLYVSGTFRGIKKKISRIHTGLQTKQ